MKKTFLIVLVFGVIAAFWIVLSLFFRLEDIQRIATHTSSYTRTHPILVFLALTLAQSLGMLFSLPTKALITLLAGALLGWAAGSVSTMIGVLSGTTALFFGARTLLRDLVTRRLGERAANLEERLSRHPIRALMGLRLFITLPYGPITLASALTTMRYRDFIVGSALGDLPVVVAYTIAGRQLFELVTVNEAMDIRTLIVLLAAGTFIFVTAVLGKKSAPVPER